MPKLYGCYYDDGAASLVTEHVEGVLMVELDEDGRKIVTTEVERQLRTLKKFKPSVWGGPGSMLS